MGTMYSLMGVEEYLNQVVNRLEAHDFLIRRRDRSYRAADNGHIL